MDSTAPQVGHRGPSGPLDPSDGEWVWVLTDTRDVGTIRDYDVVIGVADSYAMAVRLRSKYDRPTDSVEVRIERFRLNQLVW